MTAESRSQPDLLDEVIAEYLRAIEYGEQPNRNDLLARYPALVDDLREFFANHDRMQLAIAPLCEPAPLSPAGSVSTTAATFGSYEAVEEIARGGMGVVFKARDPTIGRDVAVKMLLEQHERQPDAVRRFFDEAQIGGRLQHPGIAPVYEMGRFDEQRPYFAMKLVEGQTLARLLAERREALATRGTQREPAQADLPRFLAIFQQVCQTLAYAHSRGVIHRDLKPSNVMVGAFGEVQVMDWGLAKVLAAGERGAVGDAPRTGQFAETTKSACDFDTPAAGASQTRTGSVLGTPAYMAPEQARGDNALVDQRADVFGLGAILCVILTGEPPFSGPPHDMQRLAETASLKPAFERLDACGADSELIALAKECLAADRSDRPQHAGVVAERMTAYLHSVTERLRQAELARVEADIRTAEEQKRRRLTVTWTAVVLLAAALGGAGWLAIEREHDAQIARATQNVHDAFNRALSLRNRAITSRTDLSLWVEAREQAQRALALAESGAVAPTLVDQVRQLVETLAGEERDRRLLVALNEARLIQAEPELAANRFAQERAVPLMRLAFSAYEFPVGFGEPQAAAARIRERPDLIQEAIITAFDDWIWLVEQPAFHIEEPHLNWLRETLKHADNDEWRQQLRLAIALKGRATRLAALIELAEAPGAERQPPRVLTVLANFLTTDQDVPAAVKLLLRTHRRYPDDFFVNELLVLGMQEMKPPRREEALRFATAGVALRPDSAGAVLNLGRALEDLGRGDDEIAAYRRAVELKPDYVAAHHNLGNSLLRQGHYDEALIELQKATKLSPDSSGAHDSLGSTLFRLGRTDDAIAAYRRAISLAPRVGTYKNLGNVLKYQGSIDAAIEAYDKAIDLNSDDAQAHTYRGLALAANEKFDDAIAAHRRAIDIRPSLAEAHVNLGTIFKKLGQRDEALAEFRTAVEADRNLPEAQTALGDMLMESHDYDAAVSLFRRFVDDHPGDATGWYRLGRPLWLDGHIDEAIEVYRRAIELDPNLVEAYSHLGLIIEEQHRPDEAIEMFRRGVKVRPKYAQIRNNLGQALCRQGKYDEGIDEFRKAIELSPNLVQPKNGLGRALSTLQRFSEAIPVLRSAAELQPDSGEAFYQLAEALYAERQLEEALVAYSRAAELDAQNASVAIGLANTLLKLNKLDEAQAAYRRTIELNPESAEAHCDLGNALTRLGKPREAIESCRRAIKLKPDLVNAHYQLGLALEAVNQPAEALTSFRRAVEIDPQDLSASYRLAHALISRRAYVEAETVYRRTIALKPDYAEAHCDLGSVLSALGRTDAAIESYRQALAVNPDLVEAHANLGEQLRLAKRLDEAEAALSRAIELKPDFAEVLLCLARLRVDQSRYDEAETAYRRAIELKPDFVQAHIDLGIMLMQQQRIDEAIDVHRALTRLSPEYAEGFANLGQLLQQRGDFNEALAALRRAHELGSRRGDKWLYPTGQWVQTAERLVALDARLEAVIAADGAPAGAAERIELARLCLEYKGKYLTAVRWFREAFAASPELAEDLVAGQRYRAARAAAFAADGQGDDADELEAAERNRWRTQALEWLAADLVLWNKRLDGIPADRRPAIRQSLRNWQQDPALASLREPATADLSSADHAACRKLWADLEALLDKAAPAE